MFLTGGGTFDLVPKYGSSVSRKYQKYITMAGEKTEEKVKYNPELSLTTNPTRDWEIDVRGLINTKKWLQTYGLKRNRLDLHHLMPKLGFKHCDGK